MHDLIVITTTNVEEKHGNIDYNEDYSPKTYKSSDQTRQINENQFTTARLFQQ